MRISSLDPHLAPWVALRPGLRAPGGWDGFELAVRAVLGQQVSVASARRLAGQLVALHGGSVRKASHNYPGLTRTFPTARGLATAESIGLGMPTARRKGVESAGAGRGGRSESFSTFGND